MRTSEYSDLITTLLPWQPRAQLYLSPWLQDSQHEVNTDAGPPHVLHCVWRNQQLHSMHSFLHPKAPRGKKTVMKTSKTIKKTQIVAPWKKDSWKNTINLIGSKRMVKNCRSVLCLLKALKKVEAHIEEGCSRVYQWKGWKFQKLDQKVLEMCVVSFEG